MLEGNTIPVIGARAGGYGASIAEAAVAGGAEVYGTMPTAIGCHAVGLKSP